MRLHLPLRTEKPEPPGPKGRPLVGSALDIYRNQLRFLDWMVANWGDVCAFRFGPRHGPERLKRRAWLVVRPENIQHVLQSTRGYRKAETYEPLEDLLGQGLLTSEGTFWKRQRRMIQPSFHHRRLLALGEQMGEVAAETADRWVAAARTGEIVDASPEMMGMTLEVLTRTMFSTSLSSQLDRIDGDLAVVLEHTIRRIVFPFAVLDALPTRANRRYEQAIRSMHELVDELVAARRRSGEHRDDLLGRLLAASDEEGKMSDEQVRNEVLTFLLAGHETTATGLAWTLELLSRHPDEQDRLHAELDEVLGDRDPTTDDLEQLERTRMVFEEGMRLYPPVWVIERQALVDDEIEGYRVPAGDVVMLSPWSTHRSANLWDEPLAFRPDRFEASRKAEQHRFQYFPFGGGQRACIGQHFAMLEARLALATLMRRIRVEPARTEPADPKALITLRPRHGVPLRLHER